MVDLIDMTRRSDEHTQNLIPDIEVHDNTVHEDERTISPQDPSMIEEPMITDYTVPSDSDEDSMVEENGWEVIEKVTEKGNPKLVNTNGYSYVTNKTRNGTGYWACSVKSKNVKCLSAVAERNGVFTPSLILHCHPPVAGAMTLTKLKAAFKDKAQSDQFATTPQIVDEVIDTLTRHSRVIFPIQDLYTEQRIEAARLLDRIIQTT